MRTKGRSQGRMEAALEASHILSVISAVCLWVPGDRALSPTEAFECNAHSVSLNSLKTLRLPSSFI